MTFQITKEGTKLMNILAVIASFCDKKIKNKKKRITLACIQYFYIYLDYSECRIKIQTSTEHSNKMRTS